MEARRHYRLLNEYAQKFFGYNAEEVIGKNVSILIPEQGVTGGDLTELVQSIVNQPERYVNNINENVLRDGSRVWMAWTNRPIFDEDGRVLEILAIGSDITERKRAEEALRGKEATLSVILDAAKESIWLLSPDGFIITANETALLLHGKSVGEVIGKHYAEILRTELAHSRLEHLREAVESGRAVEFEDQRNGIFFHHNLYPVLDAEDRVSSVVCFSRDITERKRAEEELRKTEQIYRAIGESIDYGVWVCAPDGKNTYASESFLKLVGITQEQCSDFGWGDVLHPEDAERTIAAWKECVHTEGTWNIEHRFLGVDGQWHPILARGVPIRDEAGEIVCWAGINLDISERKRAEENVAHLAAIVESSDDAIIGKTLDGEITTWNRAAEEIYGYTAEEVIGQSISLLAPNDSPDEVPAILQRISLGEEVRQYDALRRRKDGRNIHVSLTVSAIRDASGKINGASTIARDITERKQMEAELRNSRDALELRVLERTADLKKVNDELLIEIQERRRAEEAVRASEREFRLLADAMPQIVWITRPDGWNIYFNQQWLDYTGQTLEESYGHGWNKPFHPDDQQRAWDAWQNATKNGAVYDLECRLRRADGVYRWWLIRGVPVLDERGTVLKWFGTCTDIDERKRMEEALHKSLNELEFNVRERTATIARLELVNAELQEFAFVASHDLQEPLRKIQTFCDMAQKRCTPVLDSTSKEYLDRVVNSASRMRLLLRDLLEFSRVATRPEPFQRIDLVKIAREAADVFEASVKETGCQIEIESIPVIEADESQMLRLFQNLIGNALKFHSGETPRIRVYGKLDRKKICEIFVQDNGIGFDPQFAERIFKPFQRLHPRNEYDGTGMGLAICRKIVERHGGSIRAESEPGKGSTFIIRLPVKQDRWETYSD